MQPAVRRRNVIDMTVRRDFVHRACSVGFDHAAPVCFNHFMALTCSVNVFSNDEERRTAFLFHSVVRLVNSCAPSAVQCVKMIPLRRDR